MNLKERFQKRRKRLYLQLNKYEKYLFFFFGALIFSTINMWFAKLIFNIYISKNTWNIFIQTVGILSFLVTVLAVWISWSGDKQQLEQVSAARKEEQIAAALDKQEHALVHLEATVKSNLEAISLLRQDIDHLHSSLWRLGAQVQQIESEAIVKRRLSLLEEKLNLKCPPPYVE